MEYVVQQANPRPTLQFRVTGADGAPLQMVVLTGVAAVGPQQMPRMVVRSSGQADPGSPVAFYVPEAFAVPIAGAVCVPEVVPTQIVVDARTDLRLPYGVGEVSVTLVPTEQEPHLGWPWLSMVCHNSDFPMTVQYRVTITHPIVG